VHTGFQTKIIWNHGPRPCREARCEDFCTKVEFYCATVRAERKDVRPARTTNRLFLPEAVENECETKGSNLAGCCDSAFSR
jgi:hypothetical protein